MIPELDGGLQAYHLGSELSFGRGGFGGSESLLETRSFANQSGENEGAYGATRLTAIATAAGLDIGTWQACVATGTAQKAVRTETTQAVAAGVGATPTMRLNGQEIVGLRSVPDLSALIEAAAAAPGG